MVGPWAPKLLLGEEPTNGVVQSGTPTLYKQEISQCNLTNATATQWEMDASSFSTLFFNLFLFPHSDTWCWHELLGMEEKMKAYRDKLMES